MTVKSLRKQLAAAIAMTLVASVALGSSTYAWFVNNTKVSAELNQISSSTVTPSLFINNGTTKDDLFKTEDSNTFNGKLYPASSDDMSNWFIAREWTSGNVGGSTTTKEAQVSAFSILGDTADLDNNVVAWKTKAAGVYTTGGVDYNAFLATDYTFYTLNGNLDVYLAGSDAIKVDLTDATVNTNAATGASAVQLAQALRIGFVADNDLVYVYSPYAESGYGNTLNGSATANTYYTISGTTAAGASVTAVTDSVYKIFDGGAGGDTLNKYYATTSDGLNYTKPASNDVKLTTATTAGVSVKVYVWLEGTDAQCRVGMADGIEGVKVSINFAGVQPTTVTTGD